MVKHWYSYIILEDQIKAWDETIMSLNSGKEAKIIGKEI